MCQVCVSSVLAPHEGKRVRAGIHTRFSSCSYSYVAFAGGGGGGEDWERVASHYNSSPPPPRLIAVEI